MGEIVYLNGSLLPREKAAISPFDHGFLYGYGLFETMRAYSGRLFRIGRHLERLGRSAALFGFAEGLAAFDLERACYETLRANGLGDARLRLAVSIGEGEATPDPPSPPRPTVFILARSYTPPPAETYRKGFEAVVSSIRLNSQSPLSRLKSANYLVNVLARREARAAGAEEALLLNERGLLAEGATSNVFLVRGGTLITPEEGSGLLAGITREAVLELAPSLGIKAVEGEVTPEELLQANEAFLTNSLWEIMPLTRVGGQSLGPVGPVTARLMDAYKGIVRRELGI